MTSERPLKRSTFLAAAAAILLVALVLRQIGLSRSFWLDEAYTSWFSALPLRELWGDVPSYETHPPMYYTIVHLWRMVAGSSDWALRAPSVIAGVLTVLLVLFSGRLLRLGPKGDALSLVGGLLLAINAGHIDLSQTARPYGIQTLTASITLMASLVLLRLWSSEVYGARSRSVKWMAAVAMAVSGGMTLWLHNTSVFITLAIWGGLFVCTLLFMRRQIGHVFVVLLVAGVGALAIWGPFIPTLAAQSAAMSKMSFWLTFEWWRLVELAIMVGGGKYAVMATILLAAAGTGALLLGPYRSFAVHLVVVIAVPVAAMVLLSLLSRPVFLPRLLQWITPACLMLAATGLILVPHRLLRMALVAVSVCLTGAALPRYYASEKEPWIDATSALSERAEPGDVVIAFPNELLTVFDFYRDRLPAGTTVTYLPGPFPYRDAKRVFIGNLGAPRLEPADAETVRAVAARHGRVWLVYRGETLYDPTDIIRTTLGGIRTLKSTDIFGNITIELYE
ncbi:glycosyltransferase family 39 protein [Ciceribacter sp. L1K23]|uniref:glycosyltransferase family 39 protein n=1 Tax=Ciceribacter sp. L1K23 TaxID=2820276 RepID=UPI001B834127|nr:glycosyltransferase family 39 protein [Ciceribacter sp. L1K23]MBR0555828.1 glycosyltransferase family 39 protein [Ciceribacter sp. L1K23]